MRDFTTGDDTPSSDRGVNGLRDMVRIGDWNKQTTNWVINHKSQVVTKFALLDVLAKAIGRPTCDMYPTERGPVLGIPERLEQVITTTVTWPQMISTIRSALQNLEAVQEDSFDGPMPEVPTPAQRSHIAGVQMICNATRSVQKATYLTVQAHVQLVAFMVKWHASVSDAILRTPWKGPNEPLPAQHAPAFGR